jgi:SAM-dependent methyltransferase
VEANGLLVSGREARSRLIFGFSGCVGIWIAQEAMGAWMPTLSSSRQFWESAACENPYWYVSSFVDYHQPDVGAFWASGQGIWREVKARIGYTPTGGDTVVEIGCGIGRLTRAIAPEVGTVHAFDISRGMLEKAADGGPCNARFHLTNGASLDPVESGSADLVLAYLVFQHLPDERVYAQYLREMERVARHGGTIAFTTSPRDWRVFLLPLLRARAFVLRPIQGKGPDGLYRGEWTGIRPSERKTRALCPVPLAMRQLSRERWLFWGTKSSDGTCVR